MATQWHFKAEYIKNCNCAPGCPCDFWAGPTNYSCSGMATFHILEGKYGDVPLGGLALVLIYHWPGSQRRVKNITSAIQSTIGAFYQQTKSAIVTAVLNRERFLNTGPNWIPESGIPQSFSWSDRTAQLKSAPPRSGWLSQHIREYATQRMPATASISVSTRIKRCPP
jgi:uncharacterized protein DUF1326